MTHELADFTTRLTTALTNGRSVLVITSAGDDSNALARETAAALADDGSRVLTATMRTTPEELAEFLEPKGSGSGGGLVLCDAHLLPDSAEPVIARAQARGGAAIAYFVDKDCLNRRNERSGTVDALDAAWIRGELDRLEVPPLDDADARSVIASITGPALLCDMQLQTLVRMSDGRTRFAADLAQAAVAHPEWVPRAYPWSDSVEAAMLGASASHRLARRESVLTAEQADAIQVLALLSPLPLRTATLLVTAPTVTSLIRDGFVRTEGRPAEYVGVSPLLAAGLREVIEPLSADRIGQLDRDLAATARAGFPVGPTATLRLAHRAVRSEAALDRYDVALLLAAVEVANRAGDTLTSFVMLRRAHDASDLDRAAVNDIGRLEVATLILDGRNDDAVAAAHALVRAATEAGDEPPLSMEFLFSVASAVAGSTRMPSWWPEFLDTVVAERVPGAAAVLAARSGLRDLAVPEAQRLAMDPAIEAEIRIFALIRLCRSAQDDGRTDDLQKWATRGLELTAEVRSIRSNGPGQSADLAVRSFQAGYAVSSLTAGVNAEAVAGLLDELVDGAVMSPNRVGWATTCLVAHGKGIQHILRGELDAALLNLVTLSATAATAPLTMGWGEPGLLQRFLHRSASASRADLLLDNGAHGALSRYRLLGTFLLGPGFDEDDVTADWMRIMLVHARVMDGTLTHEQGAEALADMPDVGLPGPTAMRDHVMALARQDAGELLRLGGQLAGMNFIDAARQAIIQARAYFVAHRASAKARRADAELRRLDDVLAGRTAGTDVALRDDAVKLTRREYEVCDLVAEGLTNVKISQRMFVSVRTVESHVLSARVKLQAAKRADIPARMLELKSQGLLAPRG